MNHSMSVVHRMFLVRSKSRKVTACVSWLVAFSAFGETNTSGHCALDYVD